MSDPVVRAISPSEIRIQGSQAIPRMVHGDPRGFLLETHRADDRAVRGERFAMSYVSLTVPGQYRDRDRWHVHKIQTDRFVVAVGEMILALYDGRADSPTHDRLEAIRMSGAPFDRPSLGAKEEIPTFLVPIPPGVYHCIGNLSSHPFILVNAPTELYNPADEGRVPFSDVVPRERGVPFSWDQVEVPRPSGP